MEVDRVTRSLLGSTPPDVPSFTSSVDDILRRARGRRLRRYLGGSIAAVLVAGGVGVPLALLFGLGSSAQHAISSPSPSVRAVPGATITPIPSGAVDVAIGAGAVWVSGFGHVTRLDPATSEVVATVKTPGTEDFSQVAVGLGGVWVTADGGVVYRIDPMDNEVVAAIVVGGAIQGVDTGAGSVWVTRPREGPGELLRVDPVTNRVVNTIEVGPGPGAVLYAFGALWVTNTSPPSVDRVDPSTGTVTAMRFTGLVAAGDDSLWAASGDTVIRVDPTTGEPMATVRVPRAQAVASAGGRVWVLASPESSNPTLFYPIEHTAALWEIDPSTNQVVGSPVYLDALQPSPPTPTLRGPPRRPRTPPATCDGSGTARRSRPPGGPSPG